MKNLSKMTVYEIESWLRCKLEDKWSERDLQILSSVLFNEYQNKNCKQINTRTDREYLSKMLIKGKIERGIPPES